MIVAMLVVAIGCLPKALGEPGLLDMPGVTPKHACGHHQFIAVIDSCSTVAMDTHTKYGTWATATQR
jgi:hypothetical protein